jgi:hypothetical protein
MRNIFFIIVLTTASSLSLIKVSAQLSPLSIGTIPAGDSIVIKYDVTINNPLVPPTTTQITNQGTISGSNFSNILTDDPDTGTPGDATITLLNMFALPLTLLEFNAALNGNIVNLYWKVTDERNVEKYEIERSTTGNFFAGIGTVNAVNSSLVISYRFNDGNVAPDGDYFYRMRMVDFDGKYSYSPVVRISFRNGVPVVNAFPNPVINKTFSLYMLRMPKGKYKVELYNSYGQLIYSRMIDHAGGTSTQVVQLPQTVSNGAYHLKVSDNLGASKFIQSIVLQ